MNTDDNDLENMHGNNNDNTIDKTTCHQHLLSKYFIDLSNNPFEYPTHYSTMSSILQSIDINKSLDKPLEKQLILKINNFIIMNQPIDWIEVSSNFPSLSAMECYLHWKNQLNPSINKSIWTNHEEKLLLNLVMKYEEHDWCSIAKELNTNRTAFECLRHYQQSLNNKLLRSDDWTTEEDIMLKDTINTYGLGHWQYISDHIPGRTATQCINRYRKSSICQDSMVLGKWIEDEERILFICSIIYQLPKLSDSKKNEIEIDLLLKSITSHSIKNNKNNCNNIVDDNNSSNVVTTLVHDTTTSNKNIATSKTNIWLAVSKLIPGKNEIQCREKWVNSLDPSINKGSYIESEDEQLLKVVKALQLQQININNNSNNNSSSNDHILDNIIIDNDLIKDNIKISWVQVAEYMPGRTDASVRHRYYTLMKDVNYKTDIIKPHKISKKKRKMLPSALGRRIKSKLTENDFTSVIQVKLDN